MEYKPYKEVKMDYEILSFIKTFIDKNGYSPSVREIADGLDIKSTSTVQFHIEKLEKLGVIIKEKGIPRTLRIRGDFK